VTWLGTQSVVYIPIAPDHKEHMFLCLYGAAEKLHHWPVNEIHQ